MMDWLHRSAPATRAPGNVIVTPIWILVIRIFLFLNAAAILAVSGNSIRVESAYYHTTPYYYNKYYQPLGAPITAVRRPRSVSRLSVCQHSAGALKCD